jgi:DNA-directed RNA polymerase specialized sigma24 family protein
MSDTELMLAVAAGDESAKAAIVERHRPRIIRAATRKLDQEAAEQIADRVLARVFQFADQFDQAKAELGAWITWLTSRRATDEMRRRAA